MIIGTGLIANSLRHIDSENTLYFASGVSNSLETRSSEFEREFSLLKNTVEKYGNSKLVYFSTLSVNDLSKQNSHYVLHKLEIEKFIKNNCNSYLILRIGNIVGKGGNPNTLFNFLRTQIASGNRFKIHQKARRLLLDIEDITRFLEVQPADICHQTINFAYPYYFNLKEIVNAIEERTAQKAIYDEIDEGDFYKVNFDDAVNNFFEQVTADHYLKSLTEKYI